MKTIFEVRVACKTFLQHARARLAVAFIFPLHEDATFLLFLLYFSFASLVTYRVALTDESRCTQP